MKNIFNTLTKNLMQARKESVNLEKQYILKHKEKFKKKIENLRSVE